jgi:hypothetical protein
MPACLGAGADVARGGARRAPRARCEASGSEGRRSGQPGRPGARRRTHEAGEGAGLDCLRGQLAHGGEQWVRIAWLAPGPGRGRGDDPAPAIGAAVLLLVPLRRLLRREARRSPLAAAEAVSRGVEVAGHGAVALSGRQRIHRAIAAAQRAVIRQSREMELEIWSWSGAAAGSGAGTMDMVMGRTARITMLKRCRQKVQKASRGCGSISHSHTYMICICCLMRPCSAAVDSMPPLPPSHPPFT